MKGKDTTLDKIYDQAKQKRIALTLDEFAELLGISRATLFRIREKPDEENKDIIEKAHFLLDTKNVSREIGETEKEVHKKSYLEERQNQKLNSGTYMVPLVPVKAQAGYSRSYNNSDFLSELKSYPILPGVDPHGGIWRYFQVYGDSMLDFLNDGDYVLSNQIAKEDWPEIKDFQVYVIVTEDLVTIKRVFKRKHFKELVLVPENEMFDQRVINTEDIREIWRYRRHIGWNASSTKKFEIKV